MFVGALSAIVATFERCVFKLLSARFGGAIVTDDHTTSYLQWTHLISVPPLKPEVATRLNLPHCITKSFSLSIRLLRWWRCFLTYDPVSHRWKCLSHKVSDEQTSCFHFLLHDVTLIHCAHILSDSLPVFQSVFVCLISTFGTAFYSDFQIPDFVVKQSELGFTVRFRLYYDLHSLHELFWHFWGIHCVPIVFSYQIKT